MEENHYYPFGLKHGTYNAIRKDVKYKEQAASKKEVKQVVPEAVKFKYYYQEQERQDEFGLNWDSFKYRNYDYAIGRFMSVDPLAEKYAYNGVYNFSENRVISARELEGLEGVDFRMRLNEAVRNAPKLNMSVQEYMDKTSIRNLKSGSGSINLNVKTGTGVMWSKNASTRNSNNMTADEKARSNNHQPWYINMDNGFNLMLSSFRPTGTDNVLYNQAKNFDTAADAINEVAQNNNTGQTGNDATQNAGNNTSSGDNATQNTGNNSGQQSSDTTIVVHPVYYSSQNGYKPSKIEMSIPIHTQKNKVSQVQDSVNQENKKREQFHQ